MLRNKVLFKRCTCRAAPISSGSSSLSPFLSKSIKNFVVAFTLSTMACAFSRSCDILNRWVPNLISKPIETGSIAANRCLSKCQFRIPASIIHFFFQRCLQRTVTALAIMISNRQLLRDAHTHTHRHGQTRLNRFTGGGAAAAAAVAAAAANPHHTSSRNRLTRSATRRIAV